MSHPGSAGPAPEVERGAALFAKIGEAGLRAVIADFYDRLFPDVMIGFMFQGKDKQHLIDREYELTAKFLGAPGVTYTGRPMRTAHGQHTIFGGHFERRLQILRETIADHAVDPDVTRVWIEHTLALRDQITRDRGSECKDTSNSRPDEAMAARTDPGATIKLGRKP
ncbi:MAG: group 1 truncated hemoglobin [Deltaproteobacteria bacterium]|nr:group 1 truncated hemoglobin [Deltaproteobacteria bacterium]